MSFLQRTGRRFAASAVMVACFAASSAFAAMLATNDFETSFSDFTTDSAEALSDLVSLPEYSDNKPSGYTTEPYPFVGEDFGSCYLSVDADTNMVWRTFASRTSSVYFDSYVQFTAMQGDFEYPADSKFVIYLDSATSNLCVICATSDSDTTPVTNSLTSATVIPNSWGRLTVNVLSGSVFSFQVRLNGALLATSGNVKTFYSLMTGATVSQVGFSGTGALDDMVVRTTDPFGAAVATINGEGYATLEQALDEANGATVTLADHAGTASVTKSGTYVVDKGSYTFGGITGQNGAYVYVSTSGNVTTYTVFNKLQPAAVWDYAASGKALDTTQNGLSIEKGANNSFSNGKVAIAGSGVYSGASVVLPTGLSKVSVAVKYSNFAGLSGHPIYNNNDFYAPVFMSVEDSDGNVLGLGATNDAANLSWSWRTANGYHNNVLTRHFAQGPELPDSSGYALFSYSAADGMRLCTGTDLTDLATSEITGYHFSGRTLRNVGLGGEASSSYADGWPNLVIEKVALFTNEYLSASDVASFRFESDEDVIAISSDTTVSSINAAAGSETEIWLNVADGVTITGNAKFTASTIHFVGSGSFNIVPPENNTAMFDFSGSTGRPRIVYNGSLPNASGAYFTATTIPEWITDPMAWNGTVWIKNKGNVANFNLNNYGNALSTIRLSGIKGYFANPSDDTQYAVLEFNPAVELDDDGGAYALFVDNGFSYNSNNKYRSVSFSAMKGSGTFVAGNSADTVLVNVRKWDDFSGTLSLTNKIVVFGETNPPPTAVSGGQIWVMTNACVTVPSSKVWYAKNGIKVEGGELRASLLDRFSSDTTITTSDTGIFTLLTDSNIDDLDVSYARITGTGTLRYEGSGYRTISRSNFPTSMTVENNLADNGLIHRVPNTELTIGSLAGNGRMRSDWGNGDRNLRICQSKDTTYSGLFDSGIDRIGTVYVDSGDTAGTLTLSRTQTASNDLVIESGAKVNLTGTWVGAVTVAGTLGGTGTVSGDLTLSDRATLKVNDRSNTLSVNNLTVSGTVSVYLPATAVPGDTFLSTSAMPAFCNEAFNIYVGETLDASLRVIATPNGLKIVPKKGAKFFFH